VEERNVESENQDNEKIMNTDNQTNLEIHSHHCDVDDALREHIEEKVGGLERVWPRLDDAHIRLTCERGRFVAEITLVSGGLLTRGEETADNLRLAFDNAMDKIERQLRRYKTKSLARERRTAHREAMDATPPLPAEARLEDEGAPHAEDEGEVRVVRVKRFALKPMSPEEASLQMDLLGHSFYVFRDADNDSVGVVYKRKDGHYGLIEPDAE
jgi:putative sigma-54 modulation protein